MKKRTFALALSMIIASGVILGACGSSSDDKKSSDDKSSKDFTVAM
ncbi:BMP family ABC transporter substrate-binding protein, partial [Listeria monocytogenes]